MKKNLKRNLKREFQNTCKTAQAKQLVVGCSPSSSVPKLCRGEDDECNEYACMAHLCTAEIVVCINGRVCTISKNVF